LVLNLLIESSFCIFDKKQEAMKNYFSFILLLIGFTICKPQLVRSQSIENLQSQIESLQKEISELSFQFDAIMKKTDDVLWYNKVGDVAHIDKVYMYGPPKWKESNPTAQGAGNPLNIWSYIFISRKADQSSKYPLIVLPHGGVHGDFSTYHTHIIREFIAQGYIVVAPEYRGSTGYGKSFQQSIDYGGLEVEDVKACRDYMIENFDIVDKNRVGIVGWSHGGLIALMNIFDHPDDYQACFAGVPVSDVIARMGYKTQDYRDLFS
jgi:acetyl esterase/lipase